MIRQLPGRFEHVLGSEDAAQVFTGPLVLGADRWPNLDLIWPSKWPKHPRKTLKLFQVGSVLDYERLNHEMWNMLDVNQAGQLDQLQYLDLVPFETWHFPGILRYGHALITAGWPPKNLFCPLDKQLHQMTMSRADFCGTTLVSLIVHHIIF